MNHGSCGRHFDDTWHPPLVANVARQPRFSRKTHVFRDLVSLREQCTQPAWPTDKTSPGENKKGDTKRKKRISLLDGVAPGCGCSGQPGWTVAREPPRGRQGAGR
ncbi:hypothetical protein CDAR_393621 [Caerostris darwini]|uniref:Uncharacterized protein n=1 Tax=Caerostris darwini TaxID=1538125 RepID=A0AAV4W769_9ARAC|nr:hypothetical protein CDAR_393621 [Caerostris darwini]